MPDAVAPEDTIVNIDDITQFTKDLSESGSYYWEIKRHSGKGWKKIDKITLEECERYGKNIKRAVEDRHGNGLYKSELFDANDQRVPIAGLEKPIIFRIGTEGVGEEESPEGLRKELIETVNLMKFLNEQNAPPTAVQKDIESLREEIRSLYSQVCNQQQESDRHSEVGEKSLTLLMFESLQQSQNRQIELIKSIMDARGSTPPPLSLIDQLVALSPVVEKFWPSISSAFSKKEDKFERLKFDILVQQFRDLSEAQKQMYETMLRDRISERDTDSESEKIRTWGEAINQVTQPFAEILGNVFGKKSERGEKEGEEDPEQEGTNIQRMATEVEKMYLDKKTANEMISHLSARYKEGEIREFITNDEVKGIVRRVGGRIVQLYNYYADQFGISTMKG